MDFQLNIKNGKVVETNIQFNKQRYSLKDEICYLEYKIEKRKKSLLELENKLKLKVDEYNNMIDDYIKNKKAK